MRIGALCEEGEARLAMTPDSAVQLKKLGHTCAVETGPGVRAGFPDDGYRAVGVEIADNAADLWDSAEID